MIPARFVSTRPLILALAGLGTLAATQQPEPSAGTVGFYAIGGGTLGAGLEGSYFRDANFSNLAFTRRDMRLDFDWGIVGRPGGGLPGTKVGDIGVDLYSIRWQGQIMARFSETYTLQVEGDSVRLWIKPTNAAWGEPNLAYWPEKDPQNYQPQQTSFAFTAGTAYDLRIEYRERTGPARLRLLWSSPSTPLEVVQATAMVGSKPPDMGLTLADALPAATNWAEKYGWGVTDNPRKDGKLEFASDGWPAEDFNFVLRPMDPDVQYGIYEFTYQGSSSLSIGGSKAEILSADGSVNFGTEKKPEDGYDPTSNTTTVRVRVAHGSGSCWPAFQNTDRDGPQGQQYGTNSGISNLRIQRPITPGSETPHPADELFARDAIELLTNTLVTLRWNDVNGDTDLGNLRDGQPSGRWQDRKPWNFLNRNLADPDGRRVSLTNENHEYKILLHNRVGKDPYMQVPHFADDDYVRKLALLLRYGANRDGEPYRAPTADPYFPPLNPNLRVNLEYSNETPWNGAGQYPQSNWMREEPERLRQAWLKDPESVDGKRFAILNYDQHFDTSQSIAGLDAGKRYLALRIVEISNIFREVFGDDGMPAPGKNDPRVRPLLMHQYDNANNTARDPLFFIDNYYNRTDPASTYTGTPHPVSYYLYGGGAATYYASSNALGIDETHPLTTTIGTLESPQLADGEAVLAPSESDWSFTGTAGITAWAARSECTFGEVAESSKDVDDFSLRGFQLTVGDQDVAVYEVGRLVYAPSNGDTTMYIMDASSGESLMTYGLSLRGVAPGNTAWTRTGKSIFIMAGKSYAYPIILQAGKSYWIAAMEGAEPHASQVPLTAPEGISIDGAIAIKTIRKGWSNVYEQARLEPGAITYGPVNIRLATQPVRSRDGSLELGYLQDSRLGIANRSRSLAPEYISRQTLFLAADGSAATTITIPEPGQYALVYSIAHKPDQTPWQKPGNDEKTVNPIMVFVDTGSGEQSITPNGQTDIRPRQSGSDHEGYWAKPSFGFDFFGSAPFTTSEPNQSVQIRFAGTGKSTNQVVQIDDVQLASSAIMTSGPIPSGGGFAEGAPDVSNWEARVMSQYRFVQTFGLKAMSYEGGWYPGGDANKMPLQFASSFFDPLMVQGERNAISTLARAGMTVNTDYTFDFAIPEYALGQAKEYSRITAWQSLNNELPAEATNGLPLLSTLSHTSLTWSNLATGPHLETGGWMSWNVVAPESGRFAFAVQTSPGGTIEVLVNEAITIVKGETGGQLHNGDGVYLTKGLHNIRARALSGSFDLYAIACAKPGQPYGLAGLTGNSAYKSILCTWPKVDGAEGYNIYIKSRTESEWRRYNSQPLQLAGEPYRLTGLPADITHNVAVTYLQKGQETALSNQITAVPMREAELLRWRFDNAEGRGTAPAEVGDSLLEPSALTMVGLEPSTNGYMCKQAMGVDDPTLYDIPSALDHAYYSMQVTPKPGAQMLLQRLEFGVWASEPKEKDPRQQRGFFAEVRWSTDGFVTSQVAPVIPETGSKGYSNGGTNSGVPFVANLGSFPALQSLQQTVEFRIYLYGQFGRYRGIGKRGKLPDVALIGGVESKTP